MRQKASEVEDFCGLDVGEGLVMDGFDEPQMVVVHQECFAVSG